MSSGASLVDLSSATSLVGVSSGASLVGVSSATSLVGVSNGASLVDVNSATSLVGVGHAVTPVAKVVPLLLAQGALKKILYVYQNHSVLI